MRGAFPFFFALFVLVTMLDRPGTRLTRGISPCYKARPGINTPKKFPLSSARSRMQLSDVSSTKKAKGDV
jgi:hypothetical protein